MAEVNGPTMLKRLPWRRAQRARPSGPVTALDVDGATLHVVVGMRRGDRADLSRIVSAPLSFAADADRENPEILGKAISGALSTLRMKPSAVVMGVPRGQVMLRTLSLPQLHDVRELASMVRLQVGKDLPYRKEDAVIDFHLRPSALTAAAAPEIAGEKGTEKPEKETAPTTDALVAVVKREVVEFHEKVAKAAGLKLAALSLLPHANAQVAALARAADEGEIIGLVSLRSEELTVEIMTGGTLLFSREAPLADSSHALPVEGAAAETTAPQTPAEPETPEGEVTNGKLAPLERITIEVVRSLHSFGGMSPDLPVTKLIVTGGTGQESEVALGLESRLGLPVSVFDVGTALRLDSQERAAASGALSAIGLALSASDPAGLPFNFVDPKRPAVQRDMKRIRTLAALAAVVVLFVAVLGVRYYLVQQRKQVQQAIQREITNLAKHQTTFRRTRAQAAALQSWATEGKDWLEHYSYLSAVLPGAEELYVTSLSVGSQGTIRLNVQARSGEVLAKLDKQLREAGYDVKPQAITPGTDKFGYNFKSSVELIAPPKMKIDPARLKTPARPADDVSLNPSEKAKERTVAGQETRRGRGGGGRR